MTELTCEMPRGARVLITGATGFTGSRLTRMLCEAGCHVTAIARSQSDLTPLADLDVRWVRGDVADVDAIHEAVQDVAYVFHMATAYRQARSSVDDYRRIHVDSTKRLIAAVQGRPAFERFVHVSTVGVHGHIEGAPANEQSPFAPGDAYQSTKADAERWLSDTASEHAVPYTIIRPAGIYGPGDRRLLKVFKLAARPVFPLLGGGRCLYHLIHVDDLCRGMIRAAVSPASLGEAFIVGDPEPIPLVDIGHVVADALGRRLRVLRLPAAPFFAAAAICEATCRPLGIEPPLYRRRVAFFTKDRMFDTRKLQHVLGYTPRIDTRDGLRATTAWYREQGWL